MPDSAPPEAPAPSTALALHTGDRLALTRAWTSLTDDEMRRRAVRAAGDRDAPTLTELTLAYISSRGQAGALTSPHTLAAYRRGVTHFLIWTDTQAVSLLRPGRHTGQNYIDACLSGEGRAPATVAQRVAAARALYRALAWAGATDAQPFQDTRVAKDPTPGIEKRPPYTADEIYGVLDMADPLAKVLLLLTAHAGLRISEVLALTWGDLDEATSRIRVHGKGRKQRTVVMSGTLARALRPYRAEHGPDAPQSGQRATRADHVFSFADPETASYHLKKAFKAAGVPFRGFHAGRKYSGTKLYGQVKDFGRVAAHLGHESVDTTRRGYAQVATDDLKDVIGNW